MRLARFRQGCAAIPLVAVLLAAGIAQAGDSYWRINGREPRTTGTVTPPYPPSGRRAAADAQEMPALAQAPEPPAPDAVQETPPVVDESALRYFARQGDQRRLEAEIARLRALYPNWTPPADPLAVPVNVDSELEALWMLYSQGKHAEARQAIARRQAAEPGWQPPADLLDRLALAEARDRLVNASGIDQYETVIRIASQNPQLLTCSEVDVMWRVAAAFARTDRPDRARDAYRYVLENCDNPQERLATMQNASQLLPDDMVRDLLALEREDASGAGEFSSVRDDRARDAVARGGDDADATVPAEAVRRVEQLARDGDKASDARLLGWYAIARKDFSAAEIWFRMAQEREPGAEPAQGLALALIGLKRYADAEDIMFRWRDANEENRKVYLAAAANLLGIEPRVVLTTEVLGRIVAETATARDGPTARQLGWYARDFNQHQTAGQWFETALSWNADDEEAAFGLALTRHQLGDRSGLAELKLVWSGRSQRIADVGTPAARDERARPSATATPRDPAAAGAQPATPARARQTAASQPAAAPSRRRGCAGQVHPETLSPQAALDRGWCLMDANRPMEAAAAFEVALRGGDAARRDASYGQSLAYLRLGLVDEAAVAAAKAPQDGRRSGELQSAILAERALGAFEKGRYAEALVALDQRALIAPERIDLMVLRGYAYMNMGRHGDARRVLEAAAGTGSRDALRALAVLREQGGG